MGTSFFFRGLLHALLQLESKRSVVSPDVCEEVPLAGAAGPSVGMHF